MRIFNYFTVSKLPYFAEESEAFNDEFIEDIPEMTEEELHDPYNFYPDAAF